MSRYTLREDCFGEAKQGQNLKLGCAYTHGLENYNWIVGFSDENNSLVYVPEGSKLIGPDNQEYELRLQEIDKRREYSNEVDFMAYLNGKERRFSLDSEVNISLDRAMVLRFEKDVPEFRVLKIGQENTQAVNSKRKTLLKKILKSA